VFQAFITNLFPKALLFFFMCRILLRLACHFHLLSPPFILPGKLHPGSYAIHFTVSSQIIDCFSPLPYNLCTGICQCRVHRKEKKLMNQRANTLLHLIHCIEPVITEKYGLIIPYGAVYQNAEKRSLFANTDNIDVLLAELEKEGALEIIHDPDCNDMILGVRLK